MVIISVTYILNDPKQQRKSYRKSVTENSKSKLANRHDVGMVEINSSSSDDVQRK